MDNENKKDWFVPEDSKLGLDEDAVYQAKLIHPNDLELEKILAEDWSGEDEGTRRFTVPEEATEPQQEIPEEKPEEPDEILPASLKKLRPKSKKGYGLWGLPHVAATLIWLVVIVFAGVGLGRVGWAALADVMAFGKPN